MELAFAIPVIALLILVMYEFFALSFNAQYVHVKSRYDMNLSDYRPDCSRKSSADRKSQRTFEKKTEGATAEDHTIVFTSEMECSGL